MFGGFFAAVFMALSIHCSSGQTYCSSDVHNTLRLYNPNGNTTTEGGMLQICRSNRWRAVCDYGFGCTTEGRAACRQLGYSGSHIKSVVMYNSAQYFEVSWRYTDNQYYFCSNSHFSSLTNCSRVTPSYSSYCNYNDQVGLWCMALPSTVQCTNGDVRLVGGVAKYEGNLEYCYQGAWFPICSSFGDREATVACRQLGFSKSPKGVRFTDGRFGKTSEFTVRLSFSCYSSMYQSLASCDRYDSTCGYKCLLNYGLICFESGHDGCKEGAVRLVNSAIEYEGRVEVCSDGVWGTVCGMDIANAAVICRVAGFYGVSKFYSSNAMFGDGNRPIVYQLNCNGCETNIRSCSKFTNTYCSRFSIGGVRCHHGCTDGDIRLTGGGSETEGTVEICCNKTWGMVSGLGWGEEDAHVTCRQLQLPIEGSRYYYDSPYGKPNLTVLFSSVRCTGSESQITDCATNSLTFEEGRKLVKHIGVAGVYCKQHRSVTIRLEPSQRVLSVSADSGYVTATFLLAGISGTLATVTVTLAVCMCCCLYKIKQLSKHIDNQYGCQTHDVGPVTINPSYSKHTPAALLLADGCQYENVVD